MTDLLFRNSADEFVAFLADTNRETASFVADRIREQIASNPLRLANGNTLAIETTVTCVSTPRDGASVSDLLGVARRRVPATASVRQGPSVH